MSKNLPESADKNDQNPPKCQEARKNKPPRKQSYFTVEQVAQALVQCRGLRSKTGRMLGCAASTITDYIQRHKELQELDQEIRAARLDMCQDVVDLHVERCDLRAAMFQLRMLGKHLGYSDGTENTKPAPQPPKLALNPADAVLL